MLYREVIAVCSQIHTKHINTVCGQNVELLNVKLAVHIVTTMLWSFSYFANIMFPTLSNLHTSPYTLHIIHPAMFPRSAAAVNTLHPQQECLNMDQYFTAPI